MGAGDNTKTNITNLRTNAQVTPFGIEKDVMFSYQIASPRQGARQSAYRIYVGKDEGIKTLVWDSKWVKSEESLQIPYEGNWLEAETRYFWKVAVRDEQNQEVTSEVSWFETGLQIQSESIIQEATIQETTKNSWNDAKWIGSPMAQTNVDALNTYEITADFEVKKGDKVGFVIGGRNKDNYVLIELDIKKLQIYVYEYSDRAWLGNHEEGYKPMIIPLGGQGREDKSEGYSLPKDTYKTKDVNTLKLIVEDRKLSLSLNEVPIILKEEILPANPANQPRKAYLMSIGLKQETGKVVYSRIRVENTQTKEVYQNESFRDETGILSKLGEVIEGKLVVCNCFEMVCPIPAVHLRKCFSTKKPIQSARLYCAARGFYNVYLDGNKIGNEFFAPGFTDYRRRIPYQTYDVTQLIEANQTGEHTLYAIVAKGYYSGYCGYSGPMIYGKENSFLAKLVIRYQDGTSKVLVTDESWQYTQIGPVVDSDYLDGETYDARLEEQFFSVDRTDKNIWQSCGIKPWPEKVVPTNGSFNKEVAFQLTPQEGEGARIESVRKAVRMIENPKGHFVYDFGQNIVGVIRLKVKGERGMSIKMRYGEMAYKNGEIYIKNIRTAANTDVYILKGDKEGETYTTGFAAHGFRYVEVTGNGFELPDHNVVLDIEALVLCNIHKVTGDFECSNPLINKLQSNIMWGQKGNYLLVPTDCPQRNERMGWTGDAGAFAGTAAFNMDVESFTNKWLQDVIDAQLMYNKGGAVPDTAPLGGDNRPEGCSGWGDAAVIVPWEMYKAYGKKSILEKCYDMMAGWIAYQSSPKRQGKGIRIIEGIEQLEKSDLSSEPFIQLERRRGDHLTFDESTPFMLTATAYAAYVADLMSKIAKVLGKEADANKYKRRFEKIKKAFNEAWVKEDGTIGYWGEMSIDRKDAKGNVISQTYYSHEAGNENHPSQTAYAVAIDFNLIPEEKLEGAKRGFLQTIKERDNHLSVGFLGIAHLNTALSKVGLDDAAFSLLEQQESPGWLYSVRNGATTIWERWNSYIAETDTFGDISMNSFNHYAYGAIGEWMYQTILGICQGDAPNEIGYKHIFLKPTVGGGLTYAKGFHESPYGRIESAWSVEGDKFLYHCKIPMNTSATLYMPQGKGERKIYHLESGTYSFVSRI